MLYSDSYQRHDTKREKDGERRREEVGGIEGKKRKRKNRKRGAESRKEGERTGGHQVPGTCPPL